MHNRATHGMPVDAQPGTRNPEIDFDVRRKYAIFSRNTRFFSFSRKIAERKTPENASEHTRAKFGISDFPGSRKSEFFPRFENSIFRSAENRSFPRFLGFTMWERRSTQGFAGRSKKTDLGKTAASGAKLLPEAGLRSCLPIATGLTNCILRLTGAAKLLLRSTGLVKLPFNCCWLVCTLATTAVGGACRLLKGCWVYGCLHLFAFGSGLCVCTCWVNFGFVKSAALVPAFQARIGCWSLDLLSLAACFAFERVSHTLVDLSLYLCLVCSMRTLCADAFCDWQGCCKPLSTADGTQKPGWSCQ